MVVRKTRPLVASLAMAALLFVAGRSGADPIARWGLESRVPAGTMAFASIEDIGGVKERSARLALGKLFNDPDMQAFAAPLKAMVSQLQDQSTAMVPPQAMALLEQMQGLEGQVAVALLDLDMEAQRVEVAASLDFGANVGDFMTFLQRMRNEADPQGEHIRVVERGGRSVWEVPTPRGPTIVATVDGGAFVLATSQASLDAVLAGTPSEPLAASASFKHVRAQAGGNDTALFVYANAPRLLTLVEDQLGRGEMGAVAEALGLRQVQALAYGLSYAGDGFRDSLIVHAPHQGQGLFGVTSYEPFNPTLLAHVPANAFYYEECRTKDMAGLLGRIRGLAASIDPDAGEELDQVLAHVGDQLGVDLEGEVLGGLDGRFGSYMAMSEGGGLYPELVMMLGAKNPEAFEGVMDRLVKGIAAMITESGEAIASTRNLEWRGHKIHLLDLQGRRQRDMIPFTPTWARVGDAFAITLVPHTMKTLLHRATQKGQAGLAAQEDFQAVLAARPAAAGYVAYLDLQAILALLYDTAVPLLQTMAKPNLMPEGTPPLDWATLPPAVVIRPYLRSMGFYGTWDEKGFALDVQGPIPTIAVVGVMVAGAAFAGRSPGMAMSRQREWAEATEKPSEMRDDDMLRDLAEIQARDLARSIHLFRLQHQRLPASLYELVVEDVVKELAEDPWGRPYQLLLLDDEEAGFQVVSAGADGDYGNDDDVVVGG